MYETCDVSATPLYTWGNPSVDNKATIPYLNPGTYYFICSVSGHCDAGMKLEVRVLPNDGLPVFTRPLQAICEQSGLHCSFAYSEEKTPQVFEVMVSE